MATPLDVVLAVPELRLRLLSGASPLPAADWAHGSDLEDPTPFLSPGHLLMTTGRQFDGWVLTDYRAYVARLAAAGVVALGFGTEVVRAGTPPELVEACAEAGLPVIEIPYLTPFIAVSRAIADREAAAARERVEWALSVQDGLARAVGRGGLSAAVAAAAEALGAELWVLDADGGVLEHAGRVVGGGAVGGTGGGGGVVGGGGAVAAVGGDGAAAAGAVAAGGVEAAAVRVLRRGRRARIREPYGDGELVLQTLGASGRHHGVVAIAHGGRPDAAAESVVGTVAALAELALEHADDLRLGQRSVLEQLFQLLRDGRSDVVRRAAEVLRIALPDEPFVVLAAPLAAVTPAFRDRLERRSSDRGSRFVVAVGERLVLLVDAGESASERRLFDEHHVAAGTSAPAAWSELDLALAQADRALESAEPGRSVGVDDLAGRSVLGLLASGPAADVARARLAGLRRTTEGRAQLRAAEVWLRHNARWDPAARELGLHRHSLKLRIEALGQALDLPLDGFQGRAELWALLAAGGGAGTGSGVGGGSAAGTGSAADARARAGGGTDAGATAGTGTTRGTGSAE